MSAGGSRTDLDVALYDATTGARLTLPASVNTIDDELHPSLTPWLVEVDDDLATTPLIAARSITASAPEGPGQRVSGRALKPATRRSVIG